MKRINITLLLMVSLSISYGQTSLYHKFPDYIASWDGSFGGYQSPSCYKFSYSLLYNELMVGDTNYHVVTLGKAYYPSYAPNSPINPGMCNFNGISNYVYTIPGAIREDTILRKIYLLETDSLHEKLLYDFSLNVGDTVKTYVTNFCSPGVIVTLIDSVMINGDYRKRWTLERAGCLMNGQIIEGIGSTMGLLEPMVNFEWGGTLECFSQDYVNMYSLDNATCPLPMPLNVNHLANGINNASISPNPTKNSITISQTEPAFNKYEIYSLNGKLIAENKIESTLQKADLSGYAEGMYIVKLIGNQKVEFKKIVVIE